MIKLIKNIVIIILGILFIECDISRETKLPESLKKLEGTWQLENSNTFEIWKNQDSILIGKLIKIQNRDTTLLEKLRVIKHKNEIFYEATVIAQNGGLPIRFKLNHAENNEFVFVNTKHNFPKKIIYNLQKENLLAASISGDEKSISFNYLKIE